jgi:hypothetical protein
MSRSAARKVVWVGRTASTVFGSELARNCGGDVLLAAGYGVARGSVLTIQQAGASGQPDGRDAA